MIRPASLTLPQLQSRPLRVLLIRPPFISLRSGPPIGLAYIQDTLKRAGHEVFVWDVNLDLQNTFQSRDYNRDFVLPADHPEVPRTYERIDELCDKAMSYKPDVIGFTLSYPTDQFGKAMAERLCRHVRCIAGGPTPTQAPDQVMAYGCFKAVVVGYGEEAVHNALLHDGIHKASLNPEAPYDADYTGIEVEHYGGLLPLITTRGCPNACTFCTQNLTYVCHSIDSIEQHIRSQPNAKRILYTDSNLNVYTKRTAELFDRLSTIENMPTGHAFGVQVRKQHREYIDKFAAAGIDELRIGLESGSRDERKIMRKPHFVNDLIVEFIRNANDHGITVWAQFIFCYPAQTREHRQATLDLMNRLNDECDPEKIKFFWYKFIVHQGTEDYYESRHRVTIDPVSRQRWWNDLHNPDTVAEEFERVKPLIPTNANIYM